MPNIRTNWAHFEYCYHNNAHTQRFGPFQKSNSEKKKKTLWMKPKLRRWTQHGFIIMQIKLEMSWKYSLAIVVLCGWVSTGVLFSL